MPTPEQPSRQSTRVRPRLAKLAAWPLPQGGSPLRKEDSFSMSAKQTRTDEARAYARPAPERRRTLRRFWFPAVLLLALTAGGLTGIVLAYSLNYSRAAEEVKALATYRPSVVTRVYADDEETVIGTFALERRIPLKFEEIPD